MEDNEVAAQGGQSLWNLSLRKRVLRPNRNLLVL
jgi:hypothetical protein